MRTDISREICEKGVLGCLCNKLILPSMVNESFFNEPMNIAIFQAIKKLSEKDLPYTYIDVFESLEKKGNNIQFEYLADLDMTIIPGLATNYLVNLEKYYNQRQLIVGIKNIYTDIITKEPEEIINELANLAKLNYQNNLLPISSRAEDIYKEKEYNVMFKSGFKAIDTAVDFVPDTFYVLAGLPTLGKTSLCLNIINNVLNQNKKVLFFSLEMSEKKILNRLSAIRCNDYVNRMKEQPEIPKQITGSLDNLYLQCPYGCSFERIYIDSMKVKPDLIVIDSSTRITTSNKNKNPTLHYSEIAEKGKELTRMANCPVILIVHMNRDIYKGVERKPMLSDLYGSGAFEQQADIIQFLWQSKEVIERKELITQVVSIIAKNRDEATNEFPMEFDKPKSKFRDI